MLSRFVCNSIQPSYSRPCQRQTQRLGREAGNGVYTKGNADSVNTTGMDGLLGNGGHTQHTQYGKLVLTAYEAMLDTRRQERE